MLVERFGRDMLFMEASYLLSSVHIVKENKTTSNYFKSLKVWIRFCCCPILPEGLFECYVHF